MNMKPSRRAEIMSGFLSSLFHNNTSNAEIVLPDFSTCFNTAKMPPAHNERVPSSSSSADSFASTPGTPCYPPSQNKSMPNWPGHEQTAVTAADGKTWSLTAYQAADSSTESVFPMRSSPHSFCSRGLFNQLMRHRTLHTAAAPVLSR